MRQIVLAVAILTSLTVCSGQAEEKRSWLSDWFRAKHGRPTPTEEAQLKAERENSAYRTTPGTQPVLNQAEERFKAKLGRNTPAEEARLKAERENSAFREERRETPARSWAEETHRSKYGRYPAK
jgi:hypothetical protein